MHGSLPPDQAGLPLHVTAHRGGPRSMAARSMLGSSDGSGGTATPASASASSTRPGGTSTLSALTQLLFVRQSCW